MVERERLILFMATSLAFLENRGPQDVHSPHDYYSEYGDEFQVEIITNSQSHLYLTTPNSLGYQYHKTSAAGLPWIEADLSCKMVGG